METSLISVIIPTHNSDLTIERCVLSLTSQTYPREKFEIIVVDDGSKDNTTTIAKKVGADLVLEIDQCFPGKARNIGASKAKGNLLAFIDSDCEAEQGWLETISNESESLAAIGGPILNGNTQSLVAWAEYLMEFSEFSENKKRSITNFIPSCNLVCSKDTFLKVGGFQEEGLSEDVNFGFALKKAGVDLTFIPKLQVRHLCRTNLDKFLSTVESYAKYTLRKDKEVPGVYRLLTKTRWSIPLIFIGKLGTRTIHAIRAKKFQKFVISFPYIILGTLAFCKGVWYEIQKK